MANFTPTRHVRELKMTATAYTWTGNRTATGTWPRVGRTVATDWEILPPGTRLIIDGVPGYVVEDKGSAIKGQKIDIYMRSYAEAINFGVKTVTVQIVE